MACTSLCTASLLLGFVVQLSALSHGREAPFFTNPESLRKLIVVPEYRLLFCAIPKNANKNFFTLFRALRLPFQGGNPKPCTTFQCNTPSYWNLSENDVRDMLKDPSWHKGIFYRDPVERFLSAYKSKCEHLDDRGPEHCKAQFGDDSIPFDDAVYQIADFDVKYGADGDDKHFDLHFLRQVDFCGGLSNTLKYYDTIEQIDDDMSAKVEKMLEKVGVNATAIPEFNAMFPKTGDDMLHPGHNSHAAEELQDYIPPAKAWIADVLNAHYRQDLDLFNMTAWRP